MHATPHDENSVHKPKYMSVMLGAVVVWLASSKLRDDSRALRTIPLMDPGMNGPDGPPVERVQAILVHLLV